MITIRRRKLYGQVWLEVIEGPEQLRGVLMDYRLVLALVKGGVEVKDADAIQRELEYQALWN